MLDQISIYRHCDPELEIRTSRPNSVLHPTSTNVSYLIKITGVLVQILIHFYLLPLPRTEWFHVCLFVGLYVCLSAGLSHNYCIIIIHLDENLDAFMGIAGNWFLWVREIWCSLTESASAEEFNLQSVILVYTAVHWLLNHSLLSEISPLLPGKIFQSESLSLTALTLCLLDFIFRRYKVYIKSLTLWMWNSQSVSQSCCPKTIKGTTAAQCDMFIHYHEHESLPHTLHYYCNTECMDFKAPTHTWPCHTADSTRCSITTEFDWHLPDSPVASVGERQHSNQSDSALRHWGEQIPQHLIYFFRFDPGNIPLEKCENVLKQWCRKWSKYSCIKMM